MWESEWLITTLILAVKLCQTCFWTTLTFMRASHFFLYFDPKKKQLKHFTAAGNLLASSLFQFWTVINWAKLTRYMSAYVQEPEPRGNRSLWNIDTEQTFAKCDFLTLSRMTASVLHCVVSLNINLFPYLFRNISKIECLVQMVWGHFKSDISIKAVSSSSPRCPIHINIYYDFPHVSFKNSPFFSSK